jgi:hypothetical protein
MSNTSHRAFLSSSDSPWRPSSDAELQSELMHAASVGSSASEIEDLRERANEIRRMLHGLVRSLRTRVENEER